MESRELLIGRRIAIILRPGDDVIPAIVAACLQHGVRQGTISTMLGAFRSVTLIGTHEPIADHDAPLPESVTITGVEGTGSGVIASSPDGPVPHIHVAVGEKADGARAYAGHLLGATAHYVVEIVVDEVLSPSLVRELDDRAHGLPTLAFSPGPSH
ncbi:MAG: PPC domain-containing DNA-binding protein [Naasia sp.]